MSNKENPDSEDVQERGVSSSSGQLDVLNRSHDSIGSQRTIIEADDFASYLGEDEEGDDYNPFDDEDVDFDVNDDGGVDLSALMRGNNPYMLDFTTASMLGDSDVEEGGEEDDHSHSGNEETPRGRTPRDESREQKIGYQKAKSWLKTSVDLMQSEEDSEAAVKDGHDGNDDDDTRSYEDGEEDDDEMESPPRNLREEINNNISKINSLTHGSDMSSVYSDPVAGRDIVSDVLTALSPRTPAGGTSNTTSGHVRQDTPVVPAQSRPLSHVSHHNQQQQQYRQDHWSQQTFSNEQFHPDSQSSPKTRRSHPVSRRRHSLGDSDDEGFAPDNQLHPQHLVPNSHLSHVTSPDVSAVLSPRYTSQRMNQHRHQSFENQEVPDDEPHLQNQSLPPHLQTYAMETPLGRPRFFSARSASHENLATNSSEQWNGDSHRGHNDDFEVPDDAFRERRNSAPGLPNFYPGNICRNCAFSRDDQLFKIR